MKYLLLLNGPVEYPEMSEADFEAEMERYNRFGGYLDARNKPYTGDALHESSAARTVRKQPGGELVVTDGPYVEMNEGVGGFYIIEADSMDEAVEVARHCPNDGGVEVRQIWEFEEFS